VVQGVEWEDGEVDGGGRFGELYIKEIIELVLEYKRQSPGI